MAWTKFILIILIFGFAPHLPGLCLPVAAQDDLAELAAMQAINQQMGPPLTIDQERVAANGIRKLTGQHIDLYTDLRDRPDIDELIEVFDLAVNQWCQIFSIDPQRAQPWRMRAFIIDDKQRFKAAGLMPDGLPEFPAAYQLNHEMWVFHQPGNYYTRHLLLHEGTHAFMGWFLGGVGSPWYSEGMAEWLAAHQWTDGNLKLNYHIRDRSEAEYWGRVKIIRREFSEQNIFMSLDDILNIPPTAFRDVRYYAWAWAACQFLANHENTSQVFSGFYKKSDWSTRRFNRFVKESLDRESENWKVLNRDWYLYISELDYGNDVRKTNLIPATSTAVNEETSLVQIRADHGWQTTGLNVEPGDRIKITSDSQFQIGKTTHPWLCRPNGITIEYYQGRPVGLLLAGVAGQEPDANVPGDSLEGLLNPLPVGDNSTVEIKRSGILCFRVNESPAKMADNQGTLEVTVEKLE